MGSEMCIRDRLKAVSCWDVRFYWYELFFFNDVLMLTAPVGLLMRMNFGSMCFSRVEGVRHASR